MIDITSSPFYFSYLSDYSILSMPIIFRSYLVIISDHLSYSIFHFIHTAFYLFDYLCTSYIPTYCSTFRSLPIERSTPLISWHCSLLSFLLSSEYSLHSYW